MVRHIRFLASYVLVLALISSEFAVAQVPCPPTLSDAEGPGPVAERCTAAPKVGAPGGKFVRSNFGRDGGPEYLIGSGNIQRDAVGVGEWETWIGIPTDVYVAWTGQREIQTWNDLADPRVSVKFRSAVEELPTDVLIVHSMAMIPENTPESAKKCPNGASSDTPWPEIANGDFDTYYSDFASNMKSYLAANGRDGSRYVLRLGWEMNGDWYPWSICGDAANFKRAWAHIVTVMRAEFPNLMIDFSPARHNKHGIGKLRNWIPDSDYWDIISRSTHDSPHNGSTVVDRKTWEFNHLSNSKSDVTNLDDIDAIAAAENRWMALTEWASPWKDCDSTHIAASNVPLFIQYSYDWLQFNKDRIAYAAWFSLSCTQLHGRKSSEESILFRACFADGSC